MKKYIYLLAIVCVTLSLTFQSCKDDDEKVKNVLVTSNRTTGKFYKIDLTTGATTEIFTTTFDGSTLNDIRAFVYHPNKQLFYASVNSYKDLGDGSRAGDLFTINPSTKVATMINTNDGDGGSYEVWDAIVNWAVAKDDSLIAIGDFNGDGNGIVKFGTDGGRSLKTAEADICCGLGMIYDADKNEFLVGNGDSQDDGALDMESFNAKGESLDLVTITDFIGFPDDFDAILATSTIATKGLAKNPQDANGIVYGIVYNSETGSKKSYFVKIDMTSEEVTYISTLGENVDNQYNTLAFIPENLAK